MKPNLIKKKYDIGLCKNKKHARALIQDIADSIDDLNISIDNKINRPFGEGKTYDRIEENDKKSIIFTKNMPKNDIDIHFITAVVSIFHEKRHLELAVSGYKNASVELKMAYIANNNNRNGYYLQNYSKHITEIDAERRGIEGARNALHEMFSNKKEYIDQLLIDYVKNRIKTSTYFISKEPKTFDDIDQEFEQTLNIAAGYRDANELYKKYTENKTITDGPDYERFREMENMKLLLRNSIKNDEMYEVLMDPLWKPISDRIYNEHDTFTKNTMIASVTLYIHPDYAEKIDLSDIDLSPQNMFDMDFPKTINGKPVKKLTGKSTGKPSYNLVKKSTEKTIAKSSHEPGIIDEPDLPDDDPHDFNLL